MYVCYRVHEVPGWIYLESTKTCAQCSSGCATYSGPTPNDCTSCPAKKRLQYNGDSKGSCVQQCAKDGSCIECGLTIEGTSYCSRCAKDTDYPENGVCISFTSRKIDSSCLNVANGACVAYGAEFFRLNGGCYTSKRLPGSAVCKTGKNGSCESTVDGYEITYSGTLRACPHNCKACASGRCTSCRHGFNLENGVCKACPEGCAECPGGETCLSCLPGYYRSKSTCKACHRAVPKCSLCIVPRGSLQPVCLEYGHVPGSALSVGAISGISIAAVLVAGGVTAVAVWLLVFRKRG